MEDRLSAAALKLGLHKPTDNDEQKFEPNSEIKGFDFPYLPIITSENKKELTIGKWWLQRDENAEFDSQFVSLNTVIENAHKPNSNANKFQDNRCLVVVSGFYEWKWLDGKGKRKEKYHIQHPDGLMYLAGIYNEWYDTNEGEEVKTVSVLTRKANETMAEIHNTKQRMPVILTKELASQWLEKELDMADLGEGMNEYFEDLSLVTEITEAPLQGSLF